MCFINDVQSGGTERTERDNENLGICFPQLVIGLPCDCVVLSLNSCRPAIIRKGNGVISRLRLNRDSSTANAAARLINHAHWIVTGWVKNAATPLCVTMAATVRHDSVMSKGVSLVASEPKASPSYEACPKETTVQGNSNSDSGLLLANEPNRRN